MFGEVRRYVLNEGYKEIEIVKANPKAVDVSTKFDLGAEDVVINYCKENDLRVKILTEERGEVNLCEKPDWILILDPVDGSTNLKKGIEGSSFNAAMLPASEKIKPKNVQYALIGSLISGGFCESKKGEDTFYQGPFNGFKKKRVFSSTNEELPKACVEIDLDFALTETESPREIDIEKGKKIQRIFPLIYPIRRIKHIRRNGSAGIGLMGVATGAIDSYIDARDISTPENWLAAFLLIRESGGVFTDLNGKEICEIENLTTPYSYVASGNKKLHQQILDYLKIGIS